MGGQQFAAGGLLIDMSAMRRVVSFDGERGLIEVEAGIMWPELIGYTSSAEGAAGGKFGIVQKQTGADRLSVGGSVAANMHGRGLRFKPIIQDVESLTLVDADGEVVECSRERNRELFRLAVGGYGLFGVIARVTLRLAPRRKLEQLTVIADTAELGELFQKRIDEGFLYGDFQFAVDGRSEEFMRRGCFVCYRPAEPEAPVTGEGLKLPEEDWMGLYHLAHADPTRAFAMYSQFFLGTSGNVFWSDTSQLCPFLDGYHEALDRLAGAPVKGSEMNTEVYVPRESLAALMEAVRADFREQGTELIYGTARVVERDDESFLAWAREPFACVVFTLHVNHDPAGLEKAQSEFRRIIDRAIEFGGSYFLTYHRWATRRQVVACHPRLPEFLELKRRYDPAEIFQSDWYRHYREMFATQGGGA
jgi:FAD/FMN-containing dehydrogenase